MASLNFPVGVLDAQVVGPAVLAQPVAALHAAKLELLARPGYVIVYHVDQDCAAEQALLLELSVDKVKLLTNGLLLLIGELGLRSTFAANTGLNAALDLE